MACSEMKYICYVNKQRYRHTEEASHELKLNLNCLRAGIFYRNQRRLSMYNARGERKLCNAGVWNVLFMGANDAIHVIVLWAVINCPALLLLLECALFINHLRITGALCSENP
jgi:hypothetical protein